MKEKSPNELMNELITTHVAPIIDPLEYFSFNGMVALVFAPFFQGLFQGLGEGLARITVGKWVGLDTFTALGVRKSRI
jgi:hypothetical protein